jgi:xanthine/uracil permease
VETSKFGLRRLIPIVIGAIVLLVGLGWASQGAGMMGGSSLMDDNPTFLYLGAFLAIIGLALIAFGAISKPKVKTAAVM